MSLGVGVDGIWLDGGFVLQQRVQDVDGFPHAARYEAGEERDVGVGDVVVGDPTIAAVAEVLRSHQVILPQLHMGAVGDCRAPASPVPGQGEAGVLADDIDHPGFQLARGDVLGIGPPQRLGGRGPWRVPGRLARAEVAAVAEHGEQVSLDGVAELGIGAGGRSEVAGVAGPVFGVLEDVEEVALLHAGADLLFEFGHPGWLPYRLQVLEMRGSVGIKAEFGVAGEAGVHSGGKRRQLHLQRGREVLAAAWDAECGAVGRQPRLALVLGRSWAR